MLETDTELVSDEASQLISVPFPTEFFIHTIYDEPRHEISINVVCATSKGSGQPAHMRRLIRAFASSLNIL